LVASDPDCGRIVQDQRCRRVIEELIFHGSGSAGLLFSFTVKLADLPKANQEDPITYWRDADFLNGNLPLLTELLLRRVRVPDEPLLVIALYILS
jgi:hypothetical protein